MKNSTIAIIVALIIIILAGSVWAYMRSSSGASDSTASSTPISTDTVNQVTFNCSGGKSISAAFYPQNDTKVDLVLSDGRSMSVPHAISASGARYANANESFVFWNKGETAFITENGTTTFADCALPGSTGTATSTGSASTSASGGQTPVTPGASAGSTVTLSGKVVCLPHKNMSGPQTMECAFGLQTADGKYYGLKNLSNAGIEPGGIDTNMNISVTGTAVAPAATENYGVVSNIDVRTLTKKQ